MTQPSPPPPSMPPQSGATLTIPPAVLQTLVTAFLAAGLSTGGLGIVSGGTMPDDILREVEELHDQLEDIRELAVKVDALAVRVERLELAVDSSNRREKRNGELDLEGGSRGW